MINKFIEILKQLSIPTALIGAIAVFLGWRATSAYLLTFGISPDWMKFDIIQYVIFGWVELFLLSLIILGMFFTSLLLIEILKNFSFKAKWRLLILNILIIATYVIFLILTYIPGNKNLYKYILNYFPLIAIWWILVTLGKSVFSNQDNLLNKGSSRIYSILNSIFQSNQSINILTVVFISLFIVNFASVRGTYLASRDKTNDTHLSLISIISKSPLMIPEESILSSSKPNEYLYYYPNLRLITQSNNHIFVLRLDEVNDKTGAAKIYIIPLENIIVVNSQQWFGITPSATQISPSINTTTSP